MSTNPRRQKHLKRKFIAYILLVIILGFGLFFLNIFLNFSKPLFISPIGKTNIDESAFEKLLKKNNISFTDVSWSDNSYSIVVSNNGLVRFAGDKDINKQITSLQRILIQLTIEGKSFKSIDFRFMEPIISF